VGKTLRFVWQWLACGRRRARPTVWMLRALTGRRMVLEALGQLIGQVEQQVEAIGHLPRPRGSLLAGLDADWGAITHNDAH